MEFNILQKSNVVVLYGIDKALLTLLYKQFPEAQVKAQATSLIEHLTLQNYHVNQKQLLCVIGRDNITIAAMEHHNIICCNSFNCHHITDRLYYILYSWKQLGMNQLSDELLLADNISKADELKHELGHYISNNH